MDPSDYLAMGAVLACVVLGKATGNESRLVLGGLAVAVMTVNPTAVGMWAIVGTIPMVISEVRKMVN